MMQSMCLEDVHCPSGYHCPGDDHICRKCLGCMSWNPAVTCVRSVSDCRPCLKGEFGACRESVAKSVARELPVVINCLLLFALVLLVLDFIRRHKHTLASTWKQAPVNTADNPGQYDPAYCHKEALQVLRPLVERAPSQRWVVERESADTQTARVFHVPAYVRNAPGNDATVSPDLDLEAALMTLTEVTESHAWTPDPDPTAIVEGSVEDPTLTNETEPVFCTITESANEDMTEPIIANSTEPTNMIVTPSLVTSATDLAVPNVTEPAGSYNEIDPVRIVTESAVANVIELSVVTESATGNMTAPENNIVTHRLITSDTDLAILNVIETAESYNETEPVRIVKEPAVANVIEPAIVTETATRNMMPPENIIVTHRLLAILNVTERAGSCNETEPVRIIKEPAVDDVIEPAIVTEPATGNMTASENIIVTHRLITSNTDLAILNVIETAGSYNETEPVRIVKEPAVANVIEPAIVTESATGNMTAPEIMIVTHPLTDLAIPNVTEPAGSYSKTEPVRTVTEQSVANVIKPAIAYLTKRQIATMNESLTLISIEPANGNMVEPAHTYETEPANWLETESTTRNTEPDSANVTESAFMIATDQIIGYTTDLDIAENVIELDITNNPVPVSYELSIANVTELKTENLAESVTWIFTELSDENIEESFQNVTEHPDLIVTELNPVNIADSTIAHVTESATGTVSETTTGNITDQLIGHVSEQAVANVVTNGFLQFNTIDSYK